MKKSKRRKKLIKVLFRLSLLAFAGVFVIWGLWAGASCLIGRSRTTQNVNIFLYDDIIGKLVPVQREIPKENIHEGIIRSLIAGPEKGEFVLPTINPEAKLRSIKVTERIATVDFTAEIKDIGNINVPEKEIAYSVINTLLLLPDIDSVAFKIAGEKPSYLSETFDISGVFSDISEDAPPSHDYILYFPDKRGRFIAAETTKIKETADTKDVASFLARRYIQGTENSKFYCALSPETKVLSTSLTQTLLTVNFSSDIIKSSLSAEEESDFLKSFIWTMTELSGVESVMIEIEGSVVDSVFGHHYYKNPFTRLDEERIVDTEGSGLPVLIYFAVETGDEEYQLVPRLRYISAINDVLPQVVNILLAGPDGSESENTIISCIPKDFTGKATLEGGTVSINLIPENDFAKLKNKAVEEMFVRQIVMTLTENRVGADLVNISIDGMTQEKLPYGTFLSGDLQRNP